MDGDDRTSLRRLHAHHPRRFEAYRFVYAVISRRSRGLSIGINLNPDGACAFRCVYCCVDRQAPLPGAEVSLPRLRAELVAMLRQAEDGSIWSHPSLEATPADRRVLRDVALAGDGEPTDRPEFGAVMAMLAELRSRGVGGVGWRPIVMTNGLSISEPAVEAGLGHLDAAGGRLWVKLDAGDASRFKRINRARASFTDLIESVVRAGVRRPIVVQTLWCRLDGQDPTAAECEAYVNTVSRLLARGVRIETVQLHTVARATATPRATAVGDAVLESLAGRLRAAAPGVGVEVYGAP